MSWFVEEHKSIVLVDVDSASVGGAYARFSKKKPPRVYFTARLPIEPRGNTPVEEDMVRTLGELAKLLVEKGAPVLFRETGSGHVDGILASIGSPWQQTAIEVKTIEDKDKTFTFTRAMLESAVKGMTVPEGRVSSGELVVATLLNGYETNKAI